MSPLAERNEGTMGRDDPLPQAREIPPKDRKDSPLVPGGAPLQEAGEMPLNERTEGLPVGESNPFT